LFGVNLAKIFKKQTVAGLYSHPVVAHAPLFFDPLKCPKLAQWIFFSIRLIFNLFKEKVKEKRVHSLLKKSSLS
jgi:hypothetical protein